MPARRSQDATESLSASVPAGGFHSMPKLSRKFVARRISEGETGRLKEELKCQACGKGYKHVSSLAKHLWEHTPEWSKTSKLLISKHQQVQLLEAASILVSMNEDDEEQEEDYTSDGFLRSPKLPSRLPSLTHSVSPAPTSAAGGAMSSAVEDTPSPMELQPGTPSHREIPISSGRSISKPSSHRRRVSLSSSLGTSPAIASSLLSMAAIASPLPDRSHMPPHSHRRGSTALPRSDDDDLLDPVKEDSPDGDVFGDME